MEQGRYPRIRALREDKDMSQKEMADYLHVSQATYSRYERGELDIPTQTLIRLAKFHGVSLDHLLGLDRAQKKRPGYLR